MSYGLSFLLGQRAASVTDVRSWLEKRERYTLRDGRAAYENPATGARFELVLDFVDVGYAPVTVAFERAEPEACTREAGDEIAALVSAFDLTVDDPHEGGMGEGPFSTDGLLRGLHAQAAALRERLEAMAQGRGAVTLAAVFQPEEDRETAVEIGERVLRVSKAGASLTTNDLGAPTADDRIAVARAFLDADAPTFAGVGGLALPLPGEYPRAGLRVRLGAMSRSMVASAEQLDAQPTLRRALDVVYGLARRFGVQSVPPPSSAASAAYAAYAEDAEPPPTEVMPGLATAPGDAEATRPAGDAGGGLGAEQSTALALFLANHPSQVVDVELLNDDGSMSAGYYASRVRLSDPILITLSRRDAPNVSVELDARALSHLLRVRVMLEREVATFGLEEDGPPTLPLLIQPTAAFPGGNSHASLPVGPAPVIVMPAAPPSPVISTQAPPAVLTPSARAYTVVDPEPPSLARPSPPPFTPIVELANRRLPMSAVLRGLAEHRELWVVATTGEDGTVVPGTFLVDGLETLPVFTSEGSLEAFLARWGRRVPSLSGMPGTRLFARMAPSVAIVHVDPELPLSLAIKGRELAALRAYASTIVVERLLAHPDDPAFASTLLAYDRYRVPLLPSPGGSHRLVLVPGPNGEPLAAVATAEDCIEALFAARSDLRALATVHAMNGALLFGKLPEYRVAGMMWNPFGPGTRCVMPIAASAVVLRG